MVFIGDELAGAGFRLAGLAVRLPGAGEETEALREELARAALILIAGRVAARIPEPELRRALRAVSPLILVLPDVPGAAPRAGIARRVRLQLGVEET